MHAVILAGGVGSRLWPCSRQSRPKQFSDITGSGRTMIQATRDRLEGLAKPEDIYVITGQRYATLAREQMGELPPRNVLVEPCGRNTAPAIGLACIYLRNQGADGVMAVLPADHTIQNIEAFQAALRQAEAAAEQGYLVTLGIEPNMPHTGYGYIKRGDTRVGDTKVGEDGSAGELSVYEVEHFLEKPDHETAQRFLSEGGYYWNGGIFVVRIDRMLAEIARQMPNLYQKLEQIEGALSDPEAGEQVLVELWPEMPDISIDYGVIEGAERVAVVPLQAGWNDVGSWDALEQVLAGDETYNILVRGDVLSLDSKSNVVYGDGRFIALVGVSDLVVVDTGDALLIGHKSQMQKVKNVVEHLRLLSREELL